MSKNTKKDNKYIYHIILSNFSRLLTSNLISREEYQTACLLLDKKYKNK